MVVHTEDKIDRTRIAPLIERLEQESFAAGCWIGLIARIDRPEEESIYIRLPQALRGVVLPHAALDTASIDWAIESLRNSLT